MNTARIIEEDVASVAKSIGITLSDEDCGRVLELYPTWQESDPTGTWNLVIENIIYFLSMRNEIKNIEPEKQL
jgi:hypothetical protein